MCRWIVLLFSGFSLFLSFAKAQPGVDIKIEIQDQFLLVEQDIKDWPAQGAEFTIQSSFEILQINPAPKVQDSVDSKIRLLRFPTNQKIHIQYRIPLSFAQSSQVSFYQEQSWYLNPVHSVLANYELTWVNKTNDESVQLIHSAVPVMQEGVSALLGHFSKYEKKSESGIQLQIFLIKQDEVFAQTLLQSLLKYLEHYESLIGPYPYKSFAVVENTDPTGYAFPTMTWIGSQILRFPFILTSSLPHELLHSWWGNGVFVDTEYGNWCEGLTTYLADYFYQPSQSAKRDYRLKQLLEYENYTKTGNEISLAEFRSRGEDRGLQAVGYGKSLFVFHMLESQLGFEKFREVLRKFYASFRGRTASFRDFFNVASQVGELDLESFFNVWILKKGALDLTFESHRKEKNENVIWLKSILKPEFHQIEEMLIPISIKYQSGGSESLSVPIQSQRTTVLLREDPSFVWFDPEFNLFRKLKDQEKPNALSEVLGSEKIFLTALNSRSVDQQVLSEILKIENKKFEMIAENKVNFKKEQKVILIGSFDDIFQTHSEMRLQIQNALKERGIFRVEENLLEMPGGKFAMKGNVLFLTVPVEGSLVLLLLSSEELNGTRIVQRMLRYGAQSFVLLGPTSALSQGLWQGLDSELKVKF